MAGRIGAAEPRGAAAVGGPRGAAASKLELGPLKMPFELQVNGARVTATLTGTVRNFDGAAHLQVVDRPRVEHGGKSYLLTDQALGALLKRAGRVMDAENSCQTKVMSRGWLSGVPDAITFDGKGFRPLTKADFKPDANGVGPAPIYYHDRDVATEKL